MFGVPCPCSPSVRPCLCPPSSFLFRYPFARSRKMRSFRNEKKEAATATKDTPPASTAATKTEVADEKPATKKD
ncbi:hypothetical protein M3Y99_01880300 [Aphelenchoides fujianensis]|nr:hypothetical protein M3Y99_01880300 [Aphelenchoides fujianensis]